MMRAEATLRQELYGLLGDLPPRAQTLDVQLIAEEEREEYVLEKLVLDLNGIEPVPAYFARPKEVQGPLPVILYNHAHGGDYALGKDELLVGRKVLQQPPYADVLTRLGYRRALHRHLGVRGAARAAARERSSARCSGRVRSCGG